MVKLWKGGRMLGAVWYGGKENDRQFGGLENDFPVGGTSLRQVLSLGLMA